MGFNFKKKYKNLVISKSGKKSEKFQKLNICVGKLIKNEMLIERKFAPKKI